MTNGILAAHVTVQEEAQGLESGSHRYAGLGS